MQALCAILITSTTFGAMGRWPPSGNIVTGRLPSPPLPHSGSPRNVPDASAAKRQHLQQQQWRHTAAVMRRAAPSGAIVSLVGAGRAGLQRRRTCICEISWRQSASDGQQVIQFTKRLGEHGIGHSHRCVTDCLPCEDGRQNRNSPNESRAE